MESFYYWLGFIAFWAILFFVLVYVIMTLFWFFYKSYFIVGVMNKKQSLEGFQSCTG